MPRRFSTQPHTGSVHLLTGLHASLQEGQTESWVTITRAGTFTDPRYGKFDITPAMLAEMVKNFEGGAYGQDIFIDVAHKPDNGAAGKVSKLTVQGSRLRALVEWTPYGIESVRQRSYQYLSAEFHQEFVDNEEGKQHGCVLLGAGLTTRPVIKRLEPVRLSADGLGDGPILIHPDLIKTLSTEVTNTMNEFLKRLRESLAKLTLAEPHVAAIVESFTAAAKALGEDKTALDALTTQFEGMGKQLAEAKPEPGQPITISLQEPAAGGMSADDITKMLDERESKRAADAKQLSESLDAKKKLFTDAIDKAEGLGDDTRKELAEAVDLITAEMSDDQVRRLAEHQIASGNKLESAKKLSAMGYGSGPGGSVRIEAGEDNSIKALQETVDKRLGLTALSESMRFARTGGSLPQANKDLAEKALAQFDAEHGHKLVQQHKQLAGGDGVMSDVEVPEAWERTVLRESLYQLVGLQFVQGGTMPFGNVINLPYSYRDTAAAGMSDVRRYEGQSIQRAGVVQTFEEARPIPQKLAFEVSDELRYLTGARHLDWDAVSENTANAARIIGEDTDTLIFNEVLHGVDEYGAVALGSAEAVADVDGSNTTFPLANFPIVRPRKVFDLQGNQIGNTVNPITVTYGGSGISEYDGSGTQAAGTYYSLDYNHGEIRFVDEAGDQVVPPNAHAITAQYSYSTNCYAFNTDIGSNALDAHWDTFLFQFGRRKTIVEDKRYHSVNFSLMSGTIRDQIEQARQFSANYSRAGTDLAADGNLGRVKAIPGYKSTAPGLWMGDQRIVLGSRAQTRFRMLKGWQMGELENQKDANGRFTGKKEAYGDQYILLHTPQQLKAACTSMVLYSGTARVARA